MKQDKNRTNIGIAKIEYNEDGKPVSSSFTPKVYISNHWYGASAALLTDGVINDAEEAQKEANRVLASWFVHIEGIEMTDRETATIESEVIQCLKWPNDKPQVCEIQFFLQPRE